MVQWVKDLALPLLWLGLLLWHGFHPWPGNFHMPPPGGEAKTNKQTKKCIDLVSCNHPKILVLVVLKITIL